MEDNFAALLSQCARQDQAAFKKLYQEASPKLYSLALRLMQKPELAEDVLQEAFIKIWQKADSYNAQKGLALTWMATITRNKALDKMRSLKLKSAETEIQYEGLDFASEDLEPEHQEGLSQEMQRLRECLKQLQPSQRECILLSYYYGHTHQELSEKLNTPLGTVKAWIRRGLETLKPCLS
ncbi:sigma-70 family RNA polymerase sigma factor [Leucothrix mucor]|uniref:sigma-70 family RNA polymerase sigma factor n=1 Tax=Leucothrix mucor TaxID=45248 RepID=UPI0003B6DC60|nr:sigma-70 family RNA polymerase sigma factor [Leucothrix mucor]